MVPDDDLVLQQEFLFHLDVDIEDKALDYLIEHGIDENRLSYNGYGESQPIDTNETDEGRANNRRTEFKVIEK